MRIRMFIKNQTIILNNTFLILFSFLICLSSCKDASKPGGYNEALDDLEKGVYFGMEKEDFFTHCWDMNQSGETHHGTIGNMVMYVDSINYDPKVVINFYPKFVDNKISEMPMIFYFHAWAPWNTKELSQDSLQLQVVKYFENKYEVAFEKMESKPGYDIYYKAFGPLKVRVYKDQDNMKVMADIMHRHYMSDEK